MTKPLTHCGVRVRYARVLSFALYKDGVTHQRHTIHSMCSLHVAPAAIKSVHSVRRSGLTASCTLVFFQLIYLCFFSKYFIINLLCLQVLNMAVDDADLQLDFSSNNHAFNIHSVDYLSKNGKFSLSRKNHTHKDLGTTS